MDKNATLNIYEIRCKLSADLALKKITKEQYEGLIKYLELDRKEKEYTEKSDANFIKELHQLFKKYNLMLYVDGMSNNGRIEFISSNLSKFFYFPDGFNHIQEKEILLLPKINKRREMFNKINVSEKVHIDDLRPIFKAITSVDSTSWFYITEKDYKEMLEQLKSKYNLE